jgi:UrcA family protein
MPVLRITTFALLASRLITPALANDPGVVTMTVRVARPATVTPAATRGFKRRIADAALEACGASPYSAAEMKAAVARSQCWKVSYAGAIAQSGDGVASLPIFHSIDKP